MANILFVRATPYDEDLNGYNVQGAGIARAFCKLGHHCDYLNFHKTREEIVDLCEIDGCKARVIFKKRLRLFRTGICVDALKREFLSQYDIVICREYNQLMTYFIAGRHPNTSMYSGPYWNMFMVPAFSAIYDKLYTKKMNQRLKCKFVKSQLAKEFLEAKGYSDLIDVGVGLDTTRFENVECSDSTLKIVNYMKANRCILYIGTLDANKNIPFILQVYLKLLEKEKDIKLILIGKSEQTLKNKLLGKSNASYYEELQKTIPKRIRKSVIHINRVDNPQLQFIYPLAKAFILPSIHEIFGMVMLEAMYFGAPVITSRNGGSSTLIPNEEYGQMYEDFNIEHWVNGILRYLNDSAYTDLVKMNCKEQIRNQYTWETIAGKMLKCINESNKSIID